MAKIQTRPDAASQYRRRRRRSPPLHHHECPSAAKIDAGRWLYARRELLNQYSPAGMNGDHDIANGVVQRRQAFRYPFIGNIKAEFERHR